MTIEYSGHENEVYHCITSKRICEIMISGNVLKFKF